MPLKRNPQNPKNKSWIQLTQDFVKEWPDVLEGLSFQSMPLKYIQWVNIILKNNATIRLDIQNELKIKSQRYVAGWIKQYIETNYKNIQSVDLKFDVPRLKQDMESKTNNVLTKAFRKN